MDDIERRLRDLGERAAQELSRGPILSPHIVRRARLRKGLMALGSLGLVGLMALGGYAGVSAFGDGSSTQTVTGDVLEAAARATQEQGSVRLEFEMTSQSDGAFSQDFQAHGTGEIDFEAHRSYMKFEADGSPAGFSTFELIMDGTTTYMKGAFGPSDKWVKTDRSKTAEDSLAFGADQWSAAGILDDLRSVSEDVEIVGQEELDGMWVTHYRAILDPERAADVFDNPEPGEGLAGVADVWIDEQTLVRKVTNEFSIESDAMSMDVTIDMRFLDYGAPVDIEVPDPEDVTEDVDEATSSESGGIEQMILSGEDRFHEPVLLINLGLLNRELCLFGHDEGAKGAQIIEESTDEVFAAIEDMQEAAPAGDLGEEVVCFPDTPDDLTPLIDHPKRYTLRLRGPGGTTNVPLMSSRTIGGPDQ